MSKTETAAEASPIGEFSDCHAGLLSMLDRIGSLPGLLDAAARARQVAAEATRFGEAIQEHHRDEEQELFPAVLASAREGDERARVQAIVGRLSHEHREVEAAWSQLAPALRRAAAGHEASIDAAALVSLVDRYAAHARYEEHELLPLAQEILGRNSNHLAALGVSLHMRHAMPAVLARFGHRI